MKRFDIRTVSRWQKVAEEGGAEAQFNLGLLYANGQGVPQDFVLAHKWLNLAAMSGNRSAKDIRREVSMDMSAGEIAEAQKLAREWRSLREAQMVC